MHTPPPDRHTDCHRCRLAQNLSPQSHPDNAHLLTGWLVWAGPRFVHPGGHSHLCSKRHHREWVSRDPCRTHPLLSSPPCPHRKQEKNPWEGGHLDDHAHHREVQRPARHGRWPLVHLAAHWKQPKHKGSLSLLLAPTQPPGPTGRGTTPLERKLLLKPLGESQRAGRKKAAPEDKAQEGS